MANIYIETLTELDYGSITADDFIVVSIGGAGRKVDLYDIKTQIDGKLAKASNLSDLTNASTARSNLGLGTVATKTLGYASGNIQHNGAALSANQIVTTNASKEFVTVAPQTGYNLALGTTAGTVAEGNHTHDNRYYTEAEIDAKLTTLVDVSSMVISSAPYSVVSTLIGASLEFGWFNYLGIRLIGGYHIKYAFSTSTPTDAELTQVASCPNGGSIAMVQTAADAGKNLYLKVLFANDMTQTSTAYSAMFTVSDESFGGGFSVPSLAEALVKSSSFITSMQSELSANPMTASKIAAAQRNTLSGSGTPVSSITPDFIGQEYLDTVAKTIYKAVGTTNTDWKAITS